MKRVTEYILIALFFLSIAAMSGQYDIKKISMLGSVALLSLAGFAWLNKKKKPVMTLSSESH